jgi:HD superfamily phosphohydrolase
MKVNVIFETPNIEKCIKLKKQHIIFKRKGINETQLVLITYIEKMHKIYQNLMENGLFTMISTKLSNFFIQYTFQKINQTQYR